MTLLTSSGRLIYCVNMVICGYWLCLLETNATKQVYLFQQMEKISKGDAIYYKPYLYGQIK